MFVADSAAKVTTNAVFHGEINVSLLICVFPQFCFHGMMPLVTRCPFSKPCCLLVYLQSEVPRKEGAERRRRTQNRMWYTVDRINKKKWTNKSSLKVTGYVCEWYFTRTLSPSSPLSLQQKPVVPLNCLQGKGTLESFACRAHAWSCPQEAHTYRHSQTKEENERER